MKTLGSEIIKKVRSGTNQYAVIESTNLGFVTVRLGRNGDGARLTNLNMVGEGSISDIVVVDYSAGVPYARNIQNTLQTIAPLTAAAIPLELPIEDQLDILDPYSLGSGQYCGTVAYMPGTTTFGVPVYATGGGVAAANASTISTAKVIGMGVGGGLVLIDGFVNNGGWSLSAGSYIFLGLSGGITQTKPTSTDNAITVLGTALGSSLIRFKPELVIVELL